MQLTNLMAQFGIWNWVILAVVLFGLEAVVPGVHFLWFGVAAILVAILAFLTGMVWQWQLVAFALFAVATVFVVRRFARSDNNPSDTPDLNARGAQYIGRVVVVAEPIVSGRGKVRSRRHHLAGGRRRRRRRHARQGHRRPRHRAPGHRRLTPSPFPPTEPPLSRSTSSASVRAQRTLGEGRNRGPPRCCAPVRRMLVGIRRRNAWKAQRFPLAARNAP